MTSGTRLEPVGEIDEHLDALVAIARQVQVFQQHRQSFRVCVHDHRSATLRSATAPALPGIAAYGFSMGTLTRLPHSVQLPS